MRSGAQAKLGNELRGIGAGVSTARGLVKEVDQLVENDARLDASRRENEASARCLYPFSTDC